MRIALLLAALTLAATPVRADEAPDRSHHLTCRADDAAHVQSLVTEATKRKGAILYLHGGLSSPAYMEKTLGPWLMQSLFAAPELKDHFPVFVNYNAGLFEWENILEQLRDFAVSEAGRRAVARFAERFPDAESTDKAVQARAQDIARATLLGVMEQSGFKAYAESEDPDEYFDRILADDVLAEQVSQSLQEQKAFQDIEEDLRQYAREKHAEKGTDAKALDDKSWKVGIAVTRAFARIAIGSNHQIIPTFIEEALAMLDAYGIPIRSLAVKHWEIVDEHAIECFAAGSPGRALVDGLLAHRKRNPSFEIHTISHSAGSIPTARLIAYLAERDATLDTVHMIVPALNQQLFRKVLPKHRAVADTVRYYVLAEDSEANDRLGYKAITVYPASLLYFVSGTAEKTWYNDKMLLLDQHLQSNRNPYKRRPYRWLTRERPQEIWHYFKDLPGELLLYPGDLNEPDARPYKTPDTHECTKYPWVSPAIGTAIVGSISGRVSKAIPTPTHPKALQAGRESCGG